MPRGSTRVPGPLGRATRAGRPDDDGMALEDFVELKLGHHTQDGIEVVDVEGEIDVYTAPRLRELLIDLVNKNNYNLVVNMETGRVPRLYRSRVLLSAD